MVILGFPTIPWLGKEGYLLVCAIIVCQKFGAANVVLGLVSLHAAWTNQTKVNILPQNFLSSLRASHEQSILYRYVMNAGCGLAFVK